MLSDLQLSNISHSSPHGRLYWDFIGTTIRAGAPLTSRKTLKLPFCSDHFLKINLIQNSNLHFGSFSLFRCKVIYTQLQKKREKFKIEIFSWNRLEFNRSVVDMLNMFQSCASWLPVAVLTRFSKMVNMARLDWFIEDVCPLAVKLEGFIRNSRNPFKLILFSNYHASQSISKLTLPARTEPLNF